MASRRRDFQNRSWWNDGDKKYVIHTDPDLIPVDKLNEAYSSAEMHWVPGKMDAKVAREMLENSLCFGLYEEVGPNPINPRVPLPELEFIGIARCVTDFVTFVYLTDTWVRPDKQGTGLGTWLIKCVQELIDEMPDLRKVMLATSSWERSVPFYKKLMRMEVYGGEVSERERFEPALMQYRGPAYDRADVITKPEITSTDE